MSAPHTPTVLRAARVDGRLVDLTVADGLLTALTPHSPGPGLDLGGRVVVPGLWDNHVHFDQWALARRRLDLSGAGSAREAAALVVERLRADPPADGTLVGAGFRDGLWPDVPRADLLPATPRIVLVSADLHCCWVNTAAAEHYGVRAGVVREQDWHPIMEDVRLAGDVDRAADEAARAAAARGVVGVVDFETPFPLDAWAARIAAGSRSLRVVSSVWPPSLDEALSRGLRTGHVVPGTDGLLTMGPLKIVTDGSLNTRTAFCVDPYPGLEGTAHPCGMALVPRSKLEPLLRRATAGGLDVAVHAIGDAANTFVLDAFAATGAVGRVEHAQLLQGADVPRFTELGITASVQPEHAVDDRDVADHYWAGRTQRAFVFRSLLSAGATLALGSDAPVAPLDPWVAIAAAVHRSGDAREPWHPEQHLTLDEALAASYGPDGPLREGRVADLAVLDADPAACTPAELRGMPVAATMLGGRWTHGGVL
jgi:predicted amidohydrolase YtcJ